eukprot:TRINITY_DN30625_c0_g1_i1.p1 TRINITY_DN30625_c0_g1~~TRINITY_DN30625_c0_g1_i1.p1  ORF type:complete len:386 (+),score=69.58 TRINITY_DN30625_c0_g1_i1:123-1280(+)
MAYDGSHISHSLARHPNRKKERPPFVATVDSKDLAVDGTEDKWFFGMCADNDGCVWTAPYWTSLIGIRQGTDVTATRVGGNYSSGCKWIGMACGSNGHSYGIPFNSPVILDIHPFDPDNRVGGGDLPPMVMDDRIITFMSGVGESMGKWTGACRSTDGNIYCSPFNSDSVLVIEAEEESRFTLLPGAGDGRSKWSGAACAENGTVYCAPYNADCVLAIEPASRKLRLIRGREEKNPMTKMHAKWFGAVTGPDDKIYCAPYNAMAVLVIDPATDTFTFIGPDLEDEKQAERWRIPGKWAGGACGEDGSIYFVPYNADVVLVVKTATGTLSYLRQDADGLGKYFGACLNPLDGKIFCSPWNASNILVINTREDKPEDKQSLRRQMMG